MGRKRDFNSSPEEVDPSTPVKANNDSELELSQSPAAKRAKRSGRSNTASSIPFGTPTSAAAKTGAKKKKKKRGKFDQGDHEHDGDGDENIYNVPETFTPAPRSGGGVFGTKTRRLSVIAPCTPFSERIARARREKEEKRRGTVSLGFLEGDDAIAAAAALGKSGEGSKGDVGKSGGVDEEDDAINVDARIGDDKGKGKEVEVNGVCEQPSAKKSKKKDGASTAIKNKKRKLTLKVEMGQEGEWMVSEKEAGEMFPDLPKPAGVAGADANDDEKEGPSTSDEIEEQITRELTASAPTTSNPPSFDSQKDTFARLDLGFGIHDHGDEADDGGNDKEMKELIEEVFARPEFEYRVGGDDEAYLISVGNNMNGVVGRTRLMTGEDVASAEVHNPGYVRDVEGGGREELRAALLLPSTAPDKNDNNKDDVTAIKSLLHSLDARISALPFDGKGQQEDKMKNLTKDLREVFNGLVRLSGRVHRDEMRAGFRHEILFDGMKKIVGDLRAVMEHLGLKTETTQEGPLAKKWEKNDRDKEGKKALESCLRSYLEDMGRATGREQLGEKGRLAVEYAGRVLRGL